MWLRDFDLTPGTGEHPQDVTTATGISVRTVYKWGRRYGAEGIGGLQDRSSRLHNWIERRYNPAIKWAGLNNILRPVRIYLCQCIRHAQHWEMTRFELVPAGAKRFRGASLMHLAGPVGLTAVNDRRVPVLIPEILKHHGLVEDRNRVNAGSVGRPFGEAAIEIEKKP